MADPLSISASLVALVQTANFVVQYLKSASKANKDIRNLRNELINVRCQLVCLQVDLPDALSDKESLTPGLESLGGPHGPFKQLQAVLEDLASQLKPKEGIGKSQQILGWHFQKNEVKSVMDKISRYQALFALALQGDDLQLSRDIARGLGNVKLDVTDIKSGQEKVIFGITDIKSGQEKVQIDVTDIKSAQEESGARESLQHRRYVLNWLSNIDVLENHNAARRLHEPSTGKWFIDSPEFADWKSKTQSFMLLSGSPGNGKTILCSSAVEEISRICKENPAENVIAYFYFTFRDKEKQSVRGFLGSVVRQISASSEHLPDEVETLYKQNEALNSRPTIETLLECLGSLLKRSGKKYIVVDALDECEERELLLDSLSYLWRTKYNGFHILATSRPEVKIIQKLRPELTLEISLAESGIHNDIALYIRNQVFTDPELKKWPKKVKVLMEEKLGQKAKGMFRWVFCQLQDLKKCRQRSRLLETLDRLPTDLDETYRRIIENIEKHHHAKEALKALQWLAFSVRPLTLAELAEAAVLEPEMRNLKDRDPLREPSDILAICSSLIIIGEKASFEELLLEDEDEGWYLKGRARSSGEGAAEDQHEDDENDFESEGNGEDSEEQIDGGDLVEWENEEDEGGTPKFSGASVVTFSHFSVKEYLVSDRNRIQQGLGSTFSFSEPAAHSLISMSCLSYLLLFRDYRLSNENFALYQYAARYWPRHARIVESYPTQCKGTVSLALKLLDPKIPAFITWLRCRYRIPRPRPLLPDATALYYASKLCLPATVREMLRLTEVDVNARGGREEFALFAAASWDPVRWFGCRQIPCRGFSLSLTRLGVVTAYLGLASSSAF